MIVTEPGAVATGSEVKVVSWIRSLPLAVLKRLTWRPGHFAATEHVNVQMENRLARSAPGIDYRSVAAVFRQPVLVRHACRDAEQVSQQRLFFLRGVIQ